MKTDTPSYIARPEDKEFYERELASFIPDKVLMLIPMFGILTIVNFLNSFHRLLTIRPI